ncbi:hypothetical protein ACP70R_044971 [Stipagrostis hirtigluma subsp. patula]
MTKHHNGEISSLSVSSKLQYTSKRQCSNGGVIMLLLLIWLASLLSSPSSSTPESDGFDHFVLALQWPGTVCRSSTTGTCCSSNACCRSDPVRWFTVHGLWPSYARGYGPTCCNHPDFDMAKITNLTTELGKYWPSLYCSSPSLCSGGHGSLWAHEWEKHGTCAYPAIQDEYSYFSTALQLYSSYNVTAMLESKISIGTDDGDKYPVTELVATIKSSFGASPLLLCDRASLQELRLCFSKDLKPVDCTDGGSGRENDDVDYARSCGGDSSGAARRFVVANMLAFFVAF